MSSTNRFDYEIADDETLARFARFTETERQQREAEAQASAPIDYEGTPHPREVADAAGRKVIEDGGTEGIALAKTFDVLARAAARGDRRVMVDERPPWERAQG